MAEKSCVTRCVSDVCNTGSQIDTIHSARWAVIISARGILFSEYLLVLLQNFILLNLNSPENGAKETHP